MKHKLSREDLEVIFDVLNVYDPNDISHVYPEMGESEFTTQVEKTWKKVLSMLDYDPTISWDYTLGKPDPFCENA